MQPHVIPSKCPISTTIALGIIPAFSIPKDLAGFSKWRAGVDVSNCISTTHEIVKVQLDAVQCVSNRRGQRKETEDRKPESSDQNTQLLSMAGPVLMSVSV